MLIHVLCNICTDREEMFCTLSIASFISIVYHHERFCGSVPRLMNKHQNSSAECLLVGTICPEMFPSQPVFPAFHALATNKRIQATSLTTTHSMAENLSFTCVFDIMITLNEDVEAVERLAADVSECIEPCRRRLLSLP